MSLSRDRTQSLRMRYGKFIGCRSVRWGVQRSPVSDSGTTLSERHHFRHTILSKKCLLRFVGA